MSNMCCTITSLFSLRACCLIFGSLLSAVSLFGSVSAQAQDNPIVVENRKPGSEAWQLGKPADDISMQIKGFASDTSVNVGQQIDLHIHVNPTQTFQIQIYRLGYYDGAGARLMQTVGPFNGVSQSPPTIDPVTGMVSTNWAPSVTLDIPSSWVSGIYLVKLINAEGYDNFVPFVVRNDERSADFLFQNSITTSQAYNNFPDDELLGKSLYRYNSYGADTIAGDSRAVKVSFNRPYANHGDGLILKWEQYLIQWLEKEGYDVVYATNIDQHTNGQRLLDFKGFISGGHDEYWTSQMFDSVETARDNGIHLAFTGANVSYWQVRLEDSNRTMVSYKSPIDPIADPAQMTIKFRDLGRAEQTLIGIQYDTYNPSSSNNTAYIAQNTDHWVYTGTGFVDDNIVAGITGYEIDNLDFDYPRPPDNGTQVLLSNSPFVNHSGETSYAQASIYQADSGAWVFAAGTMSWSWALAQNGFVDRRVQNMTANILSRFLAREQDVNRYPTLQPLHSQNSAVGDTILLSLTADDAEGDPLTFSAMGLPTGLTISPSSGLISGTVTMIGLFETIVTVTDDAGGRASQQFNWTVTDPGAGCGPLIQEAEDAILNGDMQIGEDETASGGRYIHSPDGTGNHSFGFEHTATFCFTVPVTGTYTINGNVFAPDGTSDSFFVSVNGEPSIGYLWDTPTNTKYGSYPVIERNDTSPVLLELVAGNYEIIFHVRDDGTRLDKVELLLQERQDDERSQEEIERPDNGGTTPIPWYSYLPLLHGR